MIILAPKMGGSAYQKAAEEFQRIYRLVTGITIPVTEEPSETEDLVVIGTDAVQPYVFERIAGGFPVRPGTDEYCILSKKELYYSAEMRFRSPLNDAFESHKL